MSRAVGLRLTQKQLRELLALQLSDARLRSQRELDRSHLLRDDIDELVGRRSCLQCFRPCAHALEVESEPLVGGRPVRHWAWQAAVHVEPALSCHPIHMSNAVLPCSSCSVRRANK